MLLASRLSPVRTGVVLHYPDLAVLCGSVRSGDWGAVSGYFEHFPARVDRSVAVRAVAGVTRSERFLQRVVDAERDSSLARTLLGARFIVMAWDARGRALARYVRQAQWRVFHDYLQRAERLLADAVAIDPANAAAWTERVTLARGLGLGVEEGRRRYERAAEHCDVPYVAQAQLIQNLCPKWGGSIGEAHAFARACLNASQPGTLGGCVVADAHVEHAFTYERIDDIREHLGQRDVRNELVAAAGHTVLSDNFQLGHGWVAAHSNFAFALFEGGYHASAGRHFTALGRRAYRYPWNGLHVAWRTAFLSARRAARNA